MSRRTALLLAFTPIFLLLAGVGAYYAWGGVMKVRYHARLDSLRAAGEPVDWADLFQPPGPDAENGAATLLEADALYEAFEESLWEEDGLGPEALGMVPCWDEEAPWSEAERAAALEAVDRLAPYRARLEEVLAFPLLEHRPDGPMGDWLWTPLQRAVEHWELQARVDSARWPASLDRMLALLSRWRDRTGMRAIDTLLWRAVLEYCQQALQSGQLSDSDGLPRWEEMLRTEARAVGPTLRRLSRIRPVYLAWATAVYARGENPFAPLVEGMGSLRELEGIDELAAEDEEIGSLLDGLDRWHQGLAALPWFARWWGRPFLWRSAVRDLEAYERLGEVEWTSAAPVRTWLLAASREPGGERVAHPANDVRLVVHHAATLGLARVALAVHDFVRAHGRAPASLADVAPLLDGGLPEDPLTGEPFGYAVREGEALLQTDPDGPLLRFVLREPDTTEVELLQRMEETVLRWRIPVP